jgi:phosphoribosylanthranilate isomerase
VTAGNTVADGRLRRTLPLGSGTAIKVCGLTRADDVALACALGAWAVGFVFAPSPRRVGPAEVPRLLSRVLHRKALAVGVFVEESAARIARTAHEAGLDAVQLHGGGRGPRVAEVRRTLAALMDASLDPQASPRARTWPPFVIATIPVSPVEKDGPALLRLVAEAGDADMLLFDTRVDGCVGGSGVSFPWTLAGQAAGNRPFLVAGGIGPTNARAALLASGAWGVDVASGVESSPGEKDERSLRALFAALRPEMEGTRL